jgi:hypothetical protein
LGLIGRGAAVSPALPPKGIEILPSRRPKFPTRPTFFTVTPRMAVEFARAKSGTRLHHLERALRHWMNDAHRSIDHDFPVVTPSGIAASWTLDVPVVTPSGIAASWTLDRFVLNPSIVRYLTYLDRDEPEKQHRQIESVLHTYFDRNCMPKWQARALGIIAPHPPSAA